MCVCVCLRVNILHAVFVMPGRVGKACHMIIGRKDGMRCSSFKSLQPIFTGFVQLSKRTFPNEGHLSGPSLRVVCKYANTTYSTCTRPLETRPALRGRNRRVTCDIIYPPRRKEYTSVLYMIPVKHMLPEYSHRAMNSHSSSISYHIKGSKLYKRLRCN